jgi:ubiquinol-cytochrome c reductase cytochrome c subunit
MKRVVALIALLLVCASCGTFRHPPAPYRLPTDKHETDGRELYAGECAYCHGDRAQGTDRGPGIDDDAPALVDFVLRTGRMPLADKNQPMRRRPPVYTAKQVDAISKYVATFGKGPVVPHPHPERASLSHGASLYIENCAACHSTSGFGGALAQGHVPDVEKRPSDPAVPNLKHATARDVAEAIRTGPGSMPSFDKGTLSDKDVDAIVRYVGYIQHPNDKGGASIGRIGPVAEGAVGWLVGLGLLLAFSRLMGSRER